MTTKIYGDDDFDSLDYIPGLVNVVTTHITNTFSQSISGGTQTAITNVEAVITPLSTSSKILILAQWCGERAGNEYNTMFGITRNGTAIGQPPTAGSRILGIMPVAISYHANDASTMESVQLHYLDSPASTSELTYRLAATIDSTQTVYTNRTVTDSDVGYSERGTSSITLLEILV